ncbi:MAG: alpha/beta fold hydrolase [Pseudomonadota bacterium]
MDQTVDLDVREDILHRRTRSSLRYYVAEARDRNHSPPLLFIHGAFCGGWIWARNFQPYFAQNGYTSYALDLRGRQGVSSFLPSAHGLADYVADVEDLIAHLGVSPILIGHSLGGMVAQKLSALTPPPALALMASVPPEGLGLASWQLAFSNPLLFWNTATFAMSPTIGSTLVARDALFSKDAPDSIAYEVLSRAIPEAPRALMEAQLPLPSLPGFLGDTPVAVFGAADDMLIPISAVERTGQFYGVDPIIFENTGHAIMVDTRWRRVADHLLAWLATLQS